MEGYFGLRDLYGLLKAIGRLIEGSLPDGLTPKLLLRCISRNFGGAGVPSLSLQRIWDDFFEESAITYLKGRATGSRRGHGASLLPTQLELIRANLHEPRVKPDDARHLLLLVPSGAELSILQTLQNDGCIDRDKSTIVLSSDFNEDKGEVHIGHRIDAIKQAMKSGDLLVLVHQKSIYESLYDMLNQHYSGWSREQQFCRISLGVHHQICPVHPDFRCVVIADQMSAGVPKPRDPLPAPFLNRFEKARINLKGVLHAFLQPLADSLKRWAVTLLAKSQGLPEGQVSDLAVRKHFSGLDDFSSIVGAVYKELESPAHPFESGFEAELEGLCQKRALWCASASLIGGLDPTYYPEVWQTYFEKQQHGSLSDVLRRIVISDHSTPGVDEFGFRTVVTTFSTVTMPTRTIVDGEDTIDLPNINPGSQFCGPSLDLGNCGSETAVRRFLRDFFSLECTDNVAFIVAALVSPARIQHTIFVCDKERRRFSDGVHAHTKRKHVVIIRQVELHNAAGDIGSVGFNRSWLHVFVDEASLAAEGSAEDAVTGARSALPPMVTLMAASKPIDHLFDGDSKDEFTRCFGDLVASEMRTTLLVNLRYPPELDNAMASEADGDGDEEGFLSAARRINVHLAHLRELCSPASGDDPLSQRFCHLLANVVSKQLRMRVGMEARAGSNPRWQCRVARRLGQRQSTTGSLRLALCREISNEVSSCVATTLAFLDRSLNTKLFAFDSNAPSRRTLWLELFEDSIEHIARLPPKVLGAPVDVGRRAQRAFPCRAPFSFRMIELLSDLEARVSEDADAAMKLDTDEAIFEVARQLAVVARSSSCYKRWSAALAPPKATPAILSEEERHALFEDYVADLVSHNFGETVASVATGCHAEKVLQAIVIAGVDSALRVAGDAVQCPCRLAIAHVVLVRHRTVMLHVPAALAAFDDDEIEQASVDFIELVMKRGVSAKGGQGLTANFTQRAFKKLAKRDIVEASSQYLRRWCRSVEQMVAATDTFGNLASGPLVKLQFVSRFAAATCTMDIGYTRQILEKLRGWQSKDAPAVRRCCSPGSFDAIWTVADKYTPPDPPQVGLSSTAKGIFRTAMGLVSVPTVANMAPTDENKQWEAVVSLLDVYLLDFCCAKLKEGQLDRPTKKELVKVALGLRTFDSVALNTALMPLRAALMRHLVLYSNDELTRAIESLHGGSGQGHEASPVAETLFVEACSDCSIHELDGIDQLQKFVAKPLTSRVLELNAISAGCCFVRQCGVEMPHHISEKLRGVLPDVLEAVGSPELQQDLRSLLLKYLYTSCNGEGELLHFLNSDNGMDLLPWALEHGDIGELAGSGTHHRRSRLRDVFHPSPFAGYIEASAIVISATKDGGGDGAALALFSPRAACLAICAEGLAMQFDVPRPSRTRVDNLARVAKCAADQLVGNPLLQGFLPRAARGDDVLSAAARLADDPEWRSIALVAADVVCFALTCSDRSKVAASLRALLECTSDAALKRSFVISARGNETAAVIRIMRADQRANGREGRGVYMCPNGHIYAVGGGTENKCFHVVISGKCPECGASIGATDDKYGALAAGNREVTDADMPASEPSGWSATPEGNPTEVQRNLVPTTLHALRFLANAALASGEFVRGRGVATAHDYTPSIRAAWDALRTLLGANGEDVALFLHALLDDLATQGAVDVASRALCQNARERAIVEADFVAVCSPLKDGWDERRTAAHACLRERLEARDESALAAALDRLRDEDHDRLLPRRRLFKCRKAITFPLFVARFNHETIASGTVQFPLLAWLLDHNAGGVFYNQNLLRATTFLPDVIRWQSLVMRTFNRRRSFEWARTTTARDCIALIADVSDTDRSADAATAAYRGYCEAWKLAKPFVEWCELAREATHDGGEVPVGPGRGASTFPDELDEESPILFSLPYPTDEGKFVTEFIQALVASHNDALDAMEAARGTADRGTLTFGSDSEVPMSPMPIHHLTVVDVARRGVLDRLKERARDSASTSADSGIIAFDFGRVERWLQNHLLLGTRRLSWNGMSTFLFKITAKEAAAEQRARLLGRSGLDASSADHFTQEFIEKAANVRRILSSIGELSTMRSCLDESVGYLRLCSDATLDELFQRPLHEFVAGTIDGSTADDDDGGRVATKEPESDPVRREVDLGPLAWLQREGRFLKMAHLKDLYREIDGVMGNHPWHGVPECYCEALTDAMKRRLEEYSAQLRAPPRVDAMAEDDADTMSGARLYQCLLDSWDQQLRLLARNETPQSPDNANCFEYLNYSAASGDLGLDRSKFKGFRWKHIVEGYKVWDATDAAEEGRGGEEGALVAAGLPPPPQPPPTPRPPHALDAFR